MTVSQPPGLGLAGCGGFGRFVLAAVTDLPGVNVEAVTNVDRDRAATTAASCGARVVADFSALLAEADLHLVIIATPPVDNGSMARAAADAGKHVFCKNPLATSPGRLRGSDRRHRANRDRALGRLRHGWNPLDWSLERLHGARRSDGEPLPGQLRRFALENLAGDERLPADHWFWDRAISGGIFVTSCASCT